MTATAQGPAAAPSGEVARPPMLASPGRMGVDFEERVDFARLRDYRLGRVHQALEASELGAVLCFDTNNIRYMTGTQIGEWARDKLIRYSLLPRGAEPVLWDFGSAARHHRLYCPWIDPGNSRAGLNGLRGAIPPEVGLFEATAKEIHGLLVDQGVADLPIGVDVCEPPMLFALQQAGLTVRDGQQMMLTAREIKSADEIALLTTAASMVDGAYQLIVELLKPGIRENEIVADVNRLLYRMGSDDVEAINAVAGERCNPHPHNFSDRLIRPGDQAFFDIIHSFNGYRTCYYRTFSVGRHTTSQRDAYRQAREWIDVAIDLVKPGVSTDVIARCWPTAEEIGFASEMEAFGLEFGHGLGVNGHERPVISRLNSLTHPEEIKEGMVFALETYCPASDGFSAARIEEEVVVTADGAEVITLFPAEDLITTHAY